MKPQASYTTYAELAEYARQRAILSAGRGGHQEFIYWRKIMEWSQDSVLRGDDPQDEFTCLLHLLKEDGWSVNFRALFYAQAVHIRKMLLNQGHKPPRLSLNWLREAARELEMTNEYPG